MFYGMIAAHLGIVEKTVKVHRASAAARSKIEAAGGSVELLG